MLESMWSSMSSSMQLAQECLEKNEEEEAAAASANAASLEGLETFAQTIDNSKSFVVSCFRLFSYQLSIIVFKRIKAKLINTEVRFEYQPKDSDVGVALIMIVKR